MKANYEITIAQENLNGHFNFFFYKKTNVYPFFLIQKSFMKKTTVAKYFENVFKVISFEINF